MKDRTSKLLLEHKFTFANISNIFSKITKFI